MFKLLIEVIPFFELVGEFCVKVNFTTTEIISIYQINI